MDENKEIQAEETTPNENIENNDTTSTENLSATPSAEDQLAEEKDRYIRLYAEFENYKREPTKKRWTFSNMLIRILWFPCLLF